MEGLWRLPAPQDFTGRLDDLARLKALWDAPDTRRLAIQGDGGIGKSALLRRFLDTLNHDGLVWSYYHSTDTEALLDEVAQSLTGSTCKSRGLTRADEVVRLLSDRPYLLVLDGVERVQAAHGPIQDALLQYFLERVQCRVVFTTRIALEGVSHVTPYPLEGLTTEDSIQLLQIAANRKVKARIARLCGGHPLLLRLTQGAWPHVPVQPAFPGLTLRESHLIRLMSHYRKTLPELDGELLKLACLLREPVDQAELTETFANLDLSARRRGQIAERPEIVAAAIRRLSDAGLLVSNGRGGWMVHAAISQAFLSGTHARSGHLAIAGFLRDRQPSGHVGPHHLPVLEEFIHHLCAAGEAQRAYNVYVEMGSVARLVLEWAEYFRAERITRDVLAALERDAGLARPQPWVAMLLWPVAQPPYEVAPTPYHILARAEDLLHNVWRLASQGIYTRMPESRPLDRIARMYNDRALALDMLGDLDAASRHYRKALKLRRGMEQADAYRSVLYNYIENVRQRGYLPYACRLAERARRLTVMAGRATNEPEGWILLWYLRRLCGRTTLPIETVFPSPPMGTATVLITDILLREGRSREAHRLAFRTFVSVEAQDLRQTARLQGVLAGSQDLTFLDPRSLDRDDTELVAWARERGLRAFLVQALVASARLQIDPSLRDTRLKEALAIARHHRFRLLELDVRDLLGDPAVLDMAARPPIQYALHLAPAPSLPVAAVSSRHWPCPLEDAEYPGSDRPLPTLIQVQWSASLPSLLIPVAEDETGDYAAALQRMLDRYNVRDYAQAWHLMAHVAAAGYTRVAETALETLRRFNEYDPLLVELLAAAIHPHPQHIEAIRRHLRETGVGWHLRAVAHWQLGALLEAHGDWEAARKAYGEASGLGIPVRRPMIPEPACTVNLASLAESLERWRQFDAGKRYPHTLEELVPRWWARVPRCDLAGRPVFYRSNRYGTRFVLACRAHHARFDSTLGLLGTAPPSWPRPQGLGFQRLVEEVMGRFFGQKT